MTFNLQRFIYLLKRDFIIHKRWTVAAITILVFTFFLIGSAGHNFINLSQGGATTPIMLVFFCSLFILGPIFTATGLGHFTTPQNRLRHLLIPASTFEKVLSKWIYTLPLFLLLLSSLFYFFFCGYVQLYGHYFSPETVNVTDKLSMRLAPYFMLLYMIGHSIAFFFSHYYNRHAVLKGGGISIATFLIAGIISMLINYSLIKTDGLFVAFENAIWNNLNYIGTNPYHFLWIPPLFWWITFQIAKRKEV